MQTNAVCPDIWKYPPRVNLTASEPESIIVLKMHCSILRYFQISTQSAKPFCSITPLSAEISASNFHDLTQITQRRVCFNPKRTEKPKAHGFSVRFGLKHTLREV